MRILIVNGYSKSQKGLQKFSEFQYIIMKVLAEQKELIDTETEFFIRDKDNIDDFLYEVESSHLRKESSNNFDQLDIVFLSGDINIRPWQSNMKKVLTLLRMCLRVNKYLYTCAWGFQAVIFLCASNFEKNISIINGNGQGSKLSEINQMKKILGQIQQNDYFLDNTTGDLYGFNFESNQWIPKAQCGIHYRRSAEEFQSVGKYILKAPVHKANIGHKENYQVYRSRTYEDYCQIKKIHLHHWVFEGMQTEFLVPLMNTWDPHTFTFTNQNKKFTVLAESQRGALVIELQNILGVQFEPNGKYPQTLFPIKNFINKTLKNIKSQSNVIKSISSNNNGSQGSTLTEILYKQKSQSKRKALELLSQRSQKMGYGQVKNRKNNQKDSDNLIEAIGLQYNDKFKHVGYSAKKEHQPQVTSSNLVSDAKYMLSGQKIYDKEEMNLQSSDRDGNEEDLQIYKQNIQNKKRVKFLSRNQSSWQQQQQQQKQVNFQLNHENKSQNYQNLNYIDDGFSKYLQKENNQNQNTESQYNLQPSLRRNSQHVNIYKQQFIEQNSINRSQQNINLNHNNNKNENNQYIQRPKTQLQGYCQLSKQKIRQTLHPDINREFLNQQNVWVPGQMSQSITNNSIKIKALKTLTEQSIPSYMQSTLGFKKSSFSSSLKSFNFVNPQTRKGRDFGQFTTIFDGPYKSQDEIDKERQKENDRKAIGGPFRISNTLKKNNNYFQNEQKMLMHTNINNYDYRENSEPKFGRWKLAI